jgi:rubrerythrin
MSLISEYTEVKLSGNNLQHYENLGYPILRRIDKKGRNRIPRGTTIIVSVQDLMDGSSAIVRCFCDNCETSENAHDIKWMEYLEKVKEDGKTYCQKCSTKLIVPEKRRKTMLENSTSVYQWFIDNNNKDNVLNRWDKNNKYSPDEISINSGMNVLILCPIGIHKSELKNIDTQIRNNLSWECRQCNSVGCKFPASVDLWSNDNETSPFDHPYGTQDYVMWKCPDGIHKDYRRNINNAVYADFRCPECQKINKESSLQKKVKEYILSLQEEHDFIYNTEFNCNIQCKGIKNNRVLPYDNEILANYFSLITEVNGEQHYRITPWTKLIAKRDGMSPEDAFEYQQYRDQYKKDYALSQGYYYLAIPYWTEKSGEWKDLIDNKLQEIYDDLQT